MRPDDYRPFSERQGLTHGWHIGPLTVRGLAPYRQRGEVREEDAAQPLADLTMAWMVECGDSLILYQTGDGDHMETITYGDIRRASAALRAE
jgi:hypothetical protein